MATRRKSVAELREQWAGARDAWRNVPLRTNEVLPVLWTRIRKVSANCSSSAWPQIVQESTLFGLSAYNPRGQELPLESNMQRQAKLRLELRQAQSKLPLTIWDAVGVWEDGSSEPGFIVAIPRELEDEGLKLSIDLAKRHDQGAIYQFRLQHGTMMRETIGVCDPGCEAQVEIEIDNEVSDADTKAFLESTCSMK